MTIIEEKSITLSEVSSLSGDSDNGKKIKEFIKNFTKLKITDALKMKKEIEDLGIIKLKESHIVKIVDFLPIDASELNKVLVEVSLDSDEVAKIVDVVKKY
jgi:DNA-directed RNA polymerase subunit F